MGPPLFLIERRVGLVIAFAVHLQSDLTFRHQASDVLLSELALTIASNTAHVLIFFLRQNIGN